MAEHTVQPVIREFTCIQCPMGCHLTVTLASDETVASVVGNQCGRGKRYAQTEAVNPVRVVTSLARVAGLNRPVSVKTTAPVPKTMICEVLDAIAAREFALPVHIGDVLLDNVCGSGAAVVATSDLP